MTDLRDKVFSPNPAIDAAIKEMLPFFSSESQKRMRKAIQDAKKAAELHQDENTDAGARHIFREFIPAFVLNQNNFVFEYEKRIQGKTPDWLDNTTKILMESFTYERGGSAAFVERVTSAVINKCNKYKEIVVASSLRFVIAVYLDFLTGISLDDCRENSDLFRSVFDTNNSLSAILFFTETQVVDRKQHYGFFCLCRDSSFANIRNWPFDTMNLNP